MTHSPTIDSLRRSFGIERGSWWVLSERYTGWSSSRSYHPWVVTYAAARQSFYHGAPRSRKGREPSLRHERHSAGHESMCFLDYAGWVVVKDLRQLRQDWFGRPSWYSCTEPEDSDLLDRIDDSRRVGS